MNNFFAASFLIILVINFNDFYAFSTDEHSIKSPLRVAQCRATCLERFFNDGPQHGESMCLQGPDCFMCWENCELLQSNFPLWGSVCEEKEICFPGCQEACRFHAETGKRVQSQPVVHTRDQGVITISGPLAEWPRPRNADKKKPLIYIVMQRTQTGPWRQIIQTLDLTTRVPVSQNNLDAMSTLRVLVVDSSGLVTIYSPDEKSLLREAKKKRKQSLDALATEVDANSSKWSLRKVSLIHQKVLVIGEIAWNPLVKKGVYLVTWEVHGGGLKGNLFTDSTHVTLSLWPDTVYHIQVELMTRTTSVSNTKSEIMDLDTGVAQKSHLTNKSPSTKRPFGNKLNTNEDILPEKGSEIISVLVSQTSRDYLNTTGYHVLLSLKVIVVMIMVTCFCFMIFILISKFGCCSSSDDLSEKLIEDDFYYKDFQPTLSDDKLSNQPCRSLDAVNTVQNSVRNPNFTHYGLGLLQPHSYTSSSTLNDNSATILINNDTEDNVVNNTSHMQV